MVSGLPCSAWRDRYLLDEYMKCTKMAEFQILLTVGIPGHTSGLPYYISGRSPVSGGSWKVGGINLYLWGSNAGMRFAMLKT